MKSNSQINSDEDLCVQFHQKGDWAIIGLLFERYYKQVFQWYVVWNFKKYGGKLDIRVLEDLTATIFAQHLPKSLAKSADIKYFKAWLRQLAYNRLIDHLRKYKPSIDIDSFLDNNVEISSNLRLLNCKDFDFDDSDGLNWEQIDNLLIHWDIDIHDFLKSQINLLKTHQKECMTLFYLKKLSYLQIVEQTPYDLKQVKSYLQNGKRNLKRQIIATLKQLCYERKN